MTESAQPPPAMNILEIFKILPHRYPFLMIDRVVELDLQAQRVVAIKNVTVNEPHFQGHYPGYPVMPGVLQIEAMAQAAAMFIFNMPENKGKIPLLAGVDQVKFRRQVVPGDQLRIEAQLLRLKSRVAKAKAKITVEGQLVVEAELTCILSDPKPNAEA